MAPKGKERIFLSFPHCRAALDLRKDQTYLIMGTSKDIHMDRQDKLYVSRPCVGPVRSSSDLRHVIAPTQGV